MVIDNFLMDSLLKQAESIDRKRINFDLRNSSDDKSQRMLNAITPGSIVPIHRHCATSESVICLRGSLIEIFYDDLGNEIERIYLNANGPISMVQIPKGVWHSVEVMEPCVIFEAKDGKFVPDFPKDVLLL